VHGVKGYVLPTVLERIPLPFLFRFLPGYLRDGLSGLEASGMIEAGEHNEPFLDGLHLVGLILTTAS
jgi:hypothetical protein